MKLVKVSDLFDVKYWNSFELINLIEHTKLNQRSVNYISRTEKNNGISAFVEKSDIDPFPWWTITVAVWGSVLSTFLQKKPYYTGFHVLVLFPKQHMTEIELLFYCYCIRKNKYRYNYWRQANKTLKDILIPEFMPEDWKKLSIDNLDTLKREKVSNIDINLTSEKRKDFNLWWKEWIFEITLGRPIHNSNIDEELIWSWNNSIPYVTRTTNNNWVEFLVNWDEFKDSVNKWVCITIGAEWFKAFYQKWSFINWNKVNILRNKSINKYNALFICGLLNRELNKKFNYWRWATKDRLKQLKIKLPAIDWQPDWAFMENYIKALPYSANL